MRRFVLLTVMVGVLAGGSVSAGILPTLESPDGRYGFYPVSNEVSVYKNFDDGGDERGETLQLVLINSFKLGTSFTLEFTADYNFDMAPGLDRDHYVEIGIVKPITSLISVNVQRIMSSFEDESVNQFGVRLSF